MFYPEKEIIEQLEKEYPVGCKVMLDKMDDIQAPPIGTCGVCQGIDGIGSILVHWDTGSSLSVVYGEDRCHRVDVR